jgi:hypothetical protein
MRGGDDKNMFRVAKKREVETIKEEWKNLPLIIARSMRNLQRVVNSYVGPHLSLFLIMLLPARGSIDWFQLTSTPATSASAAAAWAGQLVWAHPFLQADRRSMSSSKACSFLSSFFSLPRATHASFIIGYCHLFLHVLRQ